MAERLISSRNPSWLHMGEARSSVLIYAAFHKKWMNTFNEIAPELQTRERIIILFGFCVGAEKETNDIALL